jgi:hypothetical protein
MKARRSGKIVILASLAGRATSTLGGAHYTASKAGVLGLSRHLARELAPYTINVNAINPGIIDTPMVRANTPAGADGARHGEYPLRSPGDAGGGGRADRLPFVGGLVVHYRGGGGHPRRGTDHLMRWRRTAKPSSALPRGMEQVSYDSDGADRDDHPHAEAYRGTLWALRDRIEVVGFLAREGDSAQIAGPLADVPVFHSLDDLLTATRPDAAQVMLRNNEMGPTLAHLAGEGIHLWAEKPEARRAADLYAARDIIDQKGLIFTAGYQSRFYATTEYARNLVREGLLGPLTFSHMTTATTTTRIRNPRGPLGHLFDEGSAAAASSTGSAATWSTCCCRSWRSARRR